MFEIGKIAHENGALFVVSATQAAGMIPIDLEKYKIDTMSGCGFKSFVKVIINKKKIKLKSVKNRNLVKIVT
ncbi:MAG: Cys-tRNA synthase (O-phospho-L-seryl-tRNA:Cys-tRNA synthase) [Porticoccaceae bacterium]